jgi:hydrogenase-4 membrane subunit HyfE
MARLGHNAALAFIGALSAFFVGLFLRLTRKKILLQVAG